MTDSIPSSAVGALFPACVLALTAAPAGAQCDASFTASVPRSGGWFGAALAADGDRLVVGSTDDLAYVCERGPAGWSVVAELPPNGPDTPLTYGTAVALDGGVAVVGDPLMDDGATADQGAAFVFELQAGSWVAVARLDPPAATPFGTFGRAVAVSGDRILVGAFGAAGQGFNTGAVYAYERGPGGWAFAQELVASDAAAGDAFGFAVAVEGDTALVGALFEGGAVGAVYAFEHQGAGWVEVQKLVPDDAPTPQNFGSDLALDGDLALVCARTYPASAGVIGGAYVFRRQAGAWAQEQRVLPAQGAWTGDFGWTVALRGGVGLIGAHEESAGGASTNAIGAAYVLESTADGWVLVDRWRHPTPQQLDWAGYAVALTDGEALVGVPRDDQPGAPDSGRVFALPLGCLVGVLGDSFCFGSAPAASCPCGNTAGEHSGAGCANSLARGGQLGAVGSASVAADDLAFRARSMRPDQYAQLVVADAQTVGGAPFGDGLSCLSGAVVALGIEKVFADGSSTWGPGLAGAGGWLPGDTRYFQARYRDPGASPCGNGFNVTQGVTVVFAP